MKSDVVYNIGFLSSLEMKGPGAVQLKQPLFLLISLLLCEKNWPWHIPHSSRIIPATTFAVRSLFPFLMPLLGCLEIICKRKFSPNINLA